MSRRSFALVAGVVFATLSTSAQVQPALPDYSQEAFVIETAQTTYRFENDGTGRRETSARIRIQSDAGVQQWGQLVFGFNASTERLDIQYVRVLKAGGVVVTAPADAVQELSSPIARQAPVYTDFRQKHVTVPSLRPGETLEFAFATTILTPLAQGQFWMEHDFRTGAVSLDDRLEIDVPAGRAIGLKTAPDRAPQITERGGRRLYHWRSSQTKPSAEQMAKLRELAAESGDTPPRADVRLTTFRGWDEVGRWYAGLERASRTVTPELRAKAQELTAGAATNLEKVQALYNYVALNFRYVSISLGAGRYQPRLASEVFRDQYGDCKDKHTLLATLMESVGLEASTVLIHSAAPLDPDFPSPSQFDHAITRADVDGQTVWLDVTTEVAPFRLLVAGLRDKQALVIQSASGHLDRTPADPPMANSQRWSIDGTLADAGTLKAHVAYAVRGDIEIPLRSAFRNTPAAQWKDVIEGFDESGGLDGTVGDWKVSDPAVTTQPFTIEYDVTKEGFVDGSKTTDSLVLPMSSIGLPEPDDTTKKPIVLGSPWSSDYRLRLELDPEYRARAPQSVAVSRDYADYRASYALTGRALTAERTLVTRGREIAPERLGDYAAFRRVVSSDAAQRLSVDVLAPAASARTATTFNANDMLRRAMEAMRAQKVDEAVSLLKQVVEAEPGHRQAWLLLGGAYATQQQFDEAIAAFKRHIEIDAFDERVYTGLGLVYMAQDRRDEAEAAFKKQLEVNPLDGAAEQQLADFYLRTKRFADAVPLLDRRSAAAPANARLHVSRGYAYLNVGREDDAAAAFDKAIDLEPTATTRNNVAYYLSEKATRLDRAQQYAEAAVTATAVESRNLTLARVTSRELGVLRSLASYWDTLGWVLFAKGDLGRAEPLLSASWRLSESSLVGDHLAQVYEKQGRRDLAIQTYAAALTMPRPDDATRDRLRRLAGGTDTSALEAANRNQVVGMRTVPVKWTGGTGTAEFFVLLGEKGVEDVAFVRGDAALKAAPVIDAVRAADYAALLPPSDVLSAKLIRRGALTCSTTLGKNACSLIVYPLTSTTPADQ
jgi:tetratricopeptide (TPR) repeat protein